MDYFRLLRLNQGLLAGTALVGLCSIVTGGVAGSAAGIERFRNSSDVLRNEDIAKAAGRTVAKALTEKISPNYSDKESLA